MTGYAIFLASFAGAGVLVWLARDLIFGRPPEKLDEHHHPAAE
jgi:hypothetical protein